MKCPYPKIDDREGAIADTRWRVCSPTEDLEAGLAQFAEIDAFLAMIPSRTLKGKL